MGYRTNVYFYRKTVANLFLTTIILSITIRNGQPIGHVNNVVVMCR